MKANNEIIKDNLRKNSEFEFIARLEELTLSDIDYIEELSIRENIRSKLNYQIVDNTYIKIDCSFNKYISWGIHMIYTIKIKISKVKKKEKSEEKSNN